MLIYSTRNEADCGAALVQIERYFEHEPVPGTPEAGRLDILAMLIGAYEPEHWPIDPPEPIEMVG